MWKIIRRSFKAILFFSSLLILYNLFFKGTPPPNVEIDINTNPKKDGYITVLKNQSDIYTGELILVNNLVPYRFEDDNNLINLFEAKSSVYKVKDKNVLLNQTVTYSLNNMMQEFYGKYSNNSIIVISGHRTYACQQELYDKKVAKDGVLETMQWIANPGNSEHHTGYALDFGIYYDNGTSNDYTGKGRYKWINDNAYKFGFIVRYPESKKELTGINYEPWHFRYIGNPHSFIVSKKGMCLEEYIDYLRQFKFSKKHLLITDFDNKQYEIFFTEDLNVPVPKDKKYKISGNNVDGFIVTVEV